MTSTYVDDKKRHVTLIGHRAGYNWEFLKQENPHCMLDLAIELDNSLSIKA